MAANDGEDDCKQDVASLTINCSNKDEGCQWEGEAVSLKDHLESDNGCGYVEVECPNKCEASFINSNTTKMKRKELENHLKNECYLRPYQCEHCGHQDTFRAITGNRSAMPRYRDGIYKLSNKYHYSTCPEYPQVCPNKCGVKDIKRKDKEDHRSQCPEEWVICSNNCPRTSKTLIYVTGEKGKYEHVKRKYLERHLTEECVLRSFQCEYCGLQDTYTAHYKQCPELSIECPSKCGAKDIKRKDMEEHRSQCPEEDVECPFAEAGCKERLVRREIEQHVSTTQQQHLLMVMGAYKEVKKTTEEIQKVNTELKNANEEMKQELQKTKDEHQLQLQNLSDELAQLCSKH